MIRSFAFFCFVVVLLIVTACGSSDEKPAPAIIQTVFPDSLLAWNTNSDSMSMMRDHSIPDSVITIRRIINGLNQSYPDVRVNFLKQTADTVFVEVPDATHLGEEMGDAGASAWYADAVINLTSVNGINFVSFKMDEHSHAGSTIIGRDTYKNWKRS